MKVYIKEHRLKSRIANVAWAIGLAALSILTFAPEEIQAADYQDNVLDWRFESGLDRAAFAETFKTLSKENFRITDIESFRSGRSSAVTTLWSKLPENDRWTIEVSLPIADFVKAHEAHVEKGYGLVEFEVDRTGATLHFSGIWVKSENPIDTEFYFGMESLDFSNRYGEMADRGYRLIDFEAYESNGKFRNAGIWLKNDGEEVRFYRVIPRRRMAEIAGNMEAAGFRMLDIEGYDHEGKFVFAAEWVRMKEGQESAFAFDLLPDEFYNKNSSYLKDDYRLTEFEVYEENGTSYYAGSWLKGVPGKVTATVKEPEKKKKMSLEAFRSDSDN